MLEQSCCGTDTVILACSGGSNVGQITNEAAKALTGQGVGRMYCAIGVGAGLPNFIQTTGEGTCIALDGCAVGCVKRALDNAGLQPQVYLVVTELGIEKQPGFAVSEAQIAQVTEAVQQSLPSGGPGCGCCG